MGTNSCVTGKEELGYAAGMSIAVRVMAENGLPI